MPKGTTTSSADSRFDALLAASLAAPERNPKTRTPKTQKAPPARTPSLPPEDRRVHIAITVRAIRYDCTECGSTRYENPDVGITWRSAAPNSTKCGWMRCTVDEAQSEIRYAGLPITTEVITQSGTCLRCLTAQLMKEDK